MERIDRTTYRCTACNALVRVEADDRPLVMITAQSGQPNIRVISVAGKEVHRCVLVDSPRTIRLSEPVTKPAGRVSSE